MKKFTAILLTVIMVASLFTSCSNSIAPNIDETVSVSFDESTSRSLTASLDEFMAINYYWAYKAVKKDNTGLISGKTDFAWVNGENKGLAGVTIPGFSQGIWEFTLYAYTNYDAENRDNLKLAYSGVTETTLQKNSSNIIKVTVNPNPQGYGTLFIDVSRITINPQVSDPKKFDQGNFVKDVKVTSLADGSDKPVPENKTLSLPAGAYKVTVEIKEPGNDLVYASGSVVATVYANMTTTVSGNLDEYIVPAQFDPSINPDVMNKVVYSDSVYSSTSRDVVISKKTTTGSETDSKVTATIPSAIAKSELGKAITENSSSAGATGSNTSIVFSLSVDTTNATEDSLSLEIGMNAIITVKESETSEKQISKEISTLDNYVTVEIQLQTGLRNVAVTHDSATMQKLTSLNEVITNENGAYYYADSGLLTIKTKRFSPYAITYTVPEEAYVAEINGVKYTSVQAAVNAANDNDIIDVLANIRIVDTVIVSGKNITIDLNGNTITGIRKRVIWVKDGELTLTGNGLITVTEGIDIDSSVIRVSDKENNENNAALTIGSGVVVTSDYSYGVTIFGKNKGTLVVDGTINSKVAPAISGNGSADLADTDITINGAVTTDNDNAIYHPQAGKLTINGTVKGLGGIEAKSGTKLNISSDARVEATATSVSHNPNGNGCSTSGYAIVAVENDSYKGKTQINISGGTFIGPIAIIRDNEVSAEKKASIVITGGTFSEDPSSFMSNRYQKTLNEDGMWVVTVAPVAKVIKSNGDETYYSDLYSAVSNATSGDEIDLLIDYNVTPADLRYGRASTGYYRYYVMKEIKSGVIFNGNNHTITFNVDSSSLFLNCAGEIKDLIINFNDSRNTNIVYECENSSKLTNIDVSGQLSYTTGNQAPYVYYTKGSLDFENCDSNAYIYGSGDPSCYVGIFIGYTWYSGTINFTNCSDTGEIRSGRAAIFTGNSSYGVTANFVINEYNHAGEVRTVADISTSSGKDGIVNYFYAKPSDRPSAIKVTIDGTAYANWWDIPITDLPGNGTLVNGDKDKTLALNKNADNTFQITPASDTNVSYYIVSVGTYTSLPNGSNRYYVTERIDNQSYVITSSIKYLSFVDKTWVDNNNNNLTEGNICNNKTYSLRDGSMYYLVDRDGEYVKDHNPHAPEMVSVSAYNSKGELLYSAVLNNNL